MRLRGYSLPDRQELRLETDAADQCAGAWGAGDLGEEPIIEACAVADASAGEIEPKSRREQEIQFIEGDDWTGFARMLQARRGGRRGIEFKVGGEAADPPRRHAAAGPVGPRQADGLSRREGGLDERAEVHFRPAGHGHEKEDGACRGVLREGFYPGNDPEREVRYKLGVQGGQADPEVGAEALFGGLKIAHRTSLAAGWGGQARMGGRAVAWRGWGWSRSMRGAQHFRMVVAAGLAIGAMGGLAAGAPPRPLGQIHTGPDLAAGSAPQAQGTRSAVINGRLIFTASDGVDGIEVWSSDGTEEGTFALGDINPGTGSTSTNAICRSGDLVFFAATDGIHGWELWATDGTRAGTRMVKDIVPGSSSGTPMHLADVNGTLYFASAASNGFTQRALWKSDGTEEGTVLVRDFTPENGILGGYANPIAAAGSRAVFLVSNNLSGTEVWSSDGTPAGTFALPEPWPGNQSGVQSELVSTGAQVFYVGYRDTTGGELWRTDGTATGTFMTRELVAGNRGIDPQFMQAAGGLLYFRGMDANNNPGLYKSDGTFAGTSLVRAVDMWFTYAFEKPGVMGSSIFFSAVDGGGEEPWKSDGTFAGTVRIRDLLPGNMGSQPIEMTAAGSQMFFSANVGAGRSLYKTNGTSAGTVLVKQFDAANGQIYHPSFHDVNGVLFFTADDGATGLELWRSDGTTAGTRIIKEIRPLRTTGSAAPVSPVVLETGDGPRVFFRATDATSGRELWSSDGTTAGTVRRADTLAGAGSQSATVLFTNPRTVETVNGEVVFTATNGTTGVELHRLDAGSPTGSTLVKDIRAGGDSNPESFLTIGGTLFFRADDGTSGIELWKTDGTEAGTVRVKDIRAGTNGSVPAQLTELDGALIFQATNGTNGIELWRSDGTEAGTMLVKDITAGASSGNPVGFVRFGNGLVFAATGPGGREIWFTDGTEPGTTLLVDVVPGTTGSSPGQLSPGPGGMVFVATSPELGQEVWFTDGTQEGTINLADIAPGESHSIPTSLVNAGAVWFFAAENQASGRELWATDGTAAGTRLVRDIVPGAGSSNPTSITRVQDGLVAFMAADAAHGTELWVSDGTEAGTTRVSDIAPGALNSAPGQLTALAGGLLFAADDHQNGRELFLWRPDNACPCDWDVSGVTEPMDVFEFLEDWFAGNGDFNSDGANTVPDIFGFLGCYFGCQG